MKSLLFALPILGCVDASGPQLLPEGTTGIETVSGMRMSWVVVDGEKLVSEDLSLGPAVEKPALYATANPDGWSVWNTGTLTYCIHASVLDPCTVRKALADLSVDGGTDGAGCPVSHARGATPLHFVERTCAELEGTWPYLDFEVGDTETGKAGTVFNYHGMTITFAPPVPPMPPTASNFNQSTVLHETGHALGLTHEQQRDDDVRATLINFIPSCVRTDVAQAMRQFEQPPDGVSKLTPYDIDSIMQYPSYSMSSDSDTAASTTNLTSCPASPFTTHVNTCPTELFLDPAQPNARYCTDHGWEPGVYRAQFPLGLTPDDVSAFAQLYEQTPPDGCVANARLGGEMAGGDLDGDGNADLAVSIGGAVRLYKGTINGLVYWETLSVADFAGSTPSAGDLFGAALAISSLAGTNTTGTAHQGAELFIGAPGYNHGAGAVFVWQPANARTGFAGGTTTKPTTEMVKLKRIDPPSAGEHQFGRALALGNYTAPDQLAIGAQDAGYEGYVEVMAWNGTNNFTHAFGIGTPHPGTYDGFGLALASGDLHPGTGKDELAVGAPYAVAQGDTNGAAYIYEFPGGVASAPRQIYEASPFGVGDQFGAAMKIGHRLDATHDALVVGAPTAGPGRVVTFAWDNTLNKLTNRGSEAGQNIGDGFGTALRLGDEDGDGISDLFIGAPNAANGRGTVTIRRTHAADIVKTGDANDRGFGAAIAIANFDGPGAAAANNPSLDLVVGAPLSACGASTSSGGGASYFKNQVLTHDLDKQRRFAPASASPASVVPPAVF